MSPPFRHRLRVRYAECDAQGVVFNAHYITYFDTAITELWREAIGSYSAMLEAGTDIVVAEVTVRYLAPARFDEELDIAAEVQRLGDTSMTTDFMVTRAGEDGLLTKGQIRHVFVDTRAGAKKPIPDDLRRALAPYAAAG